MPKWFRRLFGAKHWLRPVIAKMMGWWLRRGDNWHQGLCWSGVRRTWTFSGGLLRVPTMFAGSAARRLQRLLNSWGSVVVRSTHWLLEADPAREDDDQREGRLWHRAGSTMMS